MNKSMPKQKENAVAVKLEEESNRDKILIDVKKHVAIYDEEDQAEEVEEEVTKSMRMALNRLAPIQCEKIKIYGKGTTNVKLITKIIEREWNGKLGTKQGNYGQYIEIRFHQFPSIWEDVATTPDPNKPISEVIKVPNKNFIELQKIKDYNLTANKRQQHQEKEQQTEEQRNPKRIKIEY